jgi:eukaryotic-like serine/threonine-protein kinase
MVRAMQSVTGAGHVVAGRYQLLGRIGRGGMGTVWRARDMVLARDVAVKEVEVLGLATPAERKVLQERALREARVAARLNHPGLVTVHDVLEADGGIWIVMELVPSRSLARVLADEGPLPPDRAAELGTMLIDALGSAHTSGIVHRDVKPANVLLSDDGRAVLTDFGIATLNGDPRLTQVGMVMGTPGFCAPERIRGEPASPASDLWSLGATLYAAVEGHGPFESRDAPMAVLTSIVHADPPPAASAGPLGPVISALMSKDPADRPDVGTAARLLAVAAAASGSVSLPARPAFAEPAPPAPPLAQPAFPLPGPPLADPPPAPPLAEPAFPLPGPPLAEPALPPPAPALPLTGQADARAERDVSADATPIFEAVAVSFQSAEPPTAVRSPRPTGISGPQRPASLSSGGRPAAKMHSAAGSGRFGPGRHRRRFLTGGDLLAMVFAAVVCAAVAGRTVISLALRRPARLRTGGALPRYPGRGHRAVRR